MTDTDELAAKIAAARDKSSRILSVASPSPDLMRLNESAYAALENLLAGHTDGGVYLAAEECDHPEPEATGWAGWDTWVVNHPEGTGADSRNNPRICKLTEIGRHCPACTLLVYGEEANGENYVPAGDCIVRPVIARQFKERRLTHAPSPSTLRTSLLAAGWTAESPRALDDESERLARLERADYEEG